jgi:UDP:flavonoid glycosyltransferase YjiC (YdhE family)
MVVPVSASHTVVRAHNTDVIILTDSVIEAAYAGVPQIVIPAWFDLYTLAVRTEWLGHGIYANKGFEPNIDGPLLCDAIVRTLRDEEGEEGNRIKIRADEIGKICRKERGDRKAADAIIAAAEGEDCAGTR